MKYQRLILTHAIKKVPITIIADSICFLNDNVATEYTEVYTPAGMFPSVETVEEISNKLDDLAFKHKEYKDVSESRKRDLSKS